jgi:membrane-associated PAP2 superfamily phosphatase
MRTMAKLFGMVALAAVAAGAGYSTREASASVASRPEAAVFTVSIVGPGTAKTNATCEWTAVPSGGQAPYTYDWTPTSGTAFGDTYYYTFGSQSGTLNVDVLVTDANGQEAWARKRVTVSGFALEDCI